MTTGQRRADRRRCTTTPTPAPQPIIRRGTGQVINRSAASAPPPNLGGSSGAATFNFEGESLQAVVKAILGDMLGQNYVIAPGVQGTVTLATPKPVSPAAGDVAAGNGAGLEQRAHGLQRRPLQHRAGRPGAGRHRRAAHRHRRRPRAASKSRVVPLRYISATEMEKILKPYARPNAIVNVDTGRNLITRRRHARRTRELPAHDRDLRRRLDVEHVGRRVPAAVGQGDARSSPDLEKVFGEQSKSPVAGMFRFMPLEGANAVLVITSQADYLDDIQQWLERIDGAGAGVQLFSYELKYIKAKDLADRLAEVFGGGGGGSRQTSNGAPSLMPGLNSTEIKDTRRRRHQRQQQRRHRHAAAGRQRRHRRRHGQRHLSLEPDAAAAMAR